jgi:hypothetical protein
MRKGESIRRSRVETCATGRLEAKRPVTWTAAGGAEDQTSFIATGSGPE